MNKLTVNIALYSNFILFLFYFFYSLILPSSAEIAPDGTTATKVHQNGNDFTIKNGDRIGDNLFHSFIEFSVPNGGSALFNNAVDIANIFSRVTGGKRSTIDGLIRAHGNANLFLINPNGIIFGQNARLNLGGSFFASTADSLLFEGDTEFSASNPQAEPLLKVSVPIGLNFRDNPEKIENKSTVRNSAGFPVGLEVAPGNSIALVGGDININGGVLTAPKGLIELGSLSAAVTINLDENLSVEVPKNIRRGNISISNGAFINTASDSGGEISFQAKELTISSATVFSGIFPGLGTQESQGGNIKLDATNNVIIDNSNLLSASQDQGQAGNIMINSTELVSLNNLSQLNSSNSSIGNAGNIIINSRDRVTIDNSSLFSTSENQGKSGDIYIFSSGNFDLNNESVISALTTGEGDGGDINIQATTLSLNDTSGILNVTGGKGNAGNIIIQVQSFALNDGSEIQSNTEGAGNAGNIKVNADDSIVISGVAPAETFKNSSGEKFPGGFSSGLFSTSEATATGQGGTITVTTGKLTILDGATLSGRTRSNASGGNIIVNANTIDLTGGGQILTAAFNQGDAGNITLNVTEGINISGSDPTFHNRRDKVIELTKQINLEQMTDQIIDPEQVIDPVSPESGIFASAGSNSAGDAGSININGLTQAGNSSTQFLLPQLMISNNGQISVASQGEGNAGNLTITANSIDLTNGSITAATNAGNKGNIILDIADNLTLNDNSLISAKALSNADGGNVNINSQFLIAFPNKSLGDGNDIVADAKKGDGGNIEINAKSLFGIQERKASENNETNDIDASSEEGLQGEISIDTPQVDPTSGLIPLPEKVSDATDQISQNICEQGVGSEFIITGKGGLPPNPHEPLNSDEEQVGLVEPVPLRQGEEIKLEEDDIRPEKSTPEPVPAQGWIFLDNGQVMLTSYKTHDTEIKPSPQQKFNDCSPSKFKNR